MVKEVDGDEAEWGEYSEVSTDGFSPDSQRLMYTVRSGGKECVVVSGSKGKPYAKILHPRFSPNSRREAYVARRDGKYLIVVDGVEVGGKDYDDVAGWSFGFTPDSKHMVCWALRNDKMFLVVDGVEGREYDYVKEGTIMGGPGMKLVFPSPKLIHTLAVRDNEFFRVDVEIVEE